jgi:hypothetical protein
LVPVADCLLVEGRQDCLKVLTTFDLILQCGNVAICTTPSSCRNASGVLIELNGGTLDALPNCMSGFTSWIWPRPFGLAALNLAPPTRGDSDADPIAEPRERTAKASVKKPLRHLFAIEPVDGDSKRRAYDYYYSCARCHWLFMVDREGGVVAMGDHDRPLPIREGNYRVRTFAHGPCAASRRLPQ